MIREIIKEQLLLERSIAKIKANIFINFDLRHLPGKHAEKRQFRHVGQSGLVIHDVDILRLTEKVLDDIAFSITMGEIQDGVRFVISDDKYPYLNLIIEPKEVDPYEWTLFVVTTMHKQDFAIGRGQLQFKPNGKSLSVF